MTPTRDDKLRDLYHVLTEVGFASLIGIVIIVATSRLIEDLGPNIGDIIKFDPAKEISPDAQGLITVTRVGNVASCVLDPRAMMASGGSLVINARRPRPNVDFRVDWVGGHTSDGKGDCGAEAEFLLSKPELVSLIIAAGH